ncbi:MAG: carbohydrate kinase [Methylobacteriaceae bacterium]|nr:carbohydrate kinase [Methylobacteriaceae bacterium]
MPRSLTSPRPGPIIAVGGANVDLTCRADEAIQLATSNPGTIHRSFGGVARNVAMNLARLGVPTTLFSAVGTDEAAAALVADCEQAGIDCSLVLRLEAATGAYVAVLDADGELVVGIAAMEVIGALTPERIAAQQERLAAAALIFADANLAGPTLAALAGIAARHAVPLVLDPVSTRKAPRLAAVLDAGVPIFALTPNRDELAVLSGEDTTTTAGLERACAGFRARGVGNLIVGLGPAGAFLASAAGHEFLAGQAGKVHDVTGAGDAAVAAALWALRAGRDLQAAARAGQVAAALTVACADAVSGELSAEALMGALADDGERGEQ